MRELLALLAFNLINMLRCELEDEAGACWDLGRFQKSVLKTGARIVKGAHRIFVDLAQAVIPFWKKLVARLQRWRLSNRFPLPGSGLKHTRTDRGSECRAGRIVVSRRS